MSLLLDALKKAAEQKLQKEASGETELESGYDVEASSLTETAVDFPVNEEALDRTTLDIEEPGSETLHETDKTDFLKEDDTQLDQDDWSLEDATAFDLTRSVDATEFPEPARQIPEKFNAGTDDTLLDDTGLGIDASTDTGGLQREWQALSNETHHSTTKSDTYYPPVQGTPQTVSLTKNIENERAAFQPSANQAAYMFANKHSDSKKQNRKFVLAGVIVCGFIVLAGLYGYEYILTISDDSASYRPIRPSRPMQLEPELSAETTSMSSFEEEALVDSTLLVEQEDYAELLGEEDIGLDNDQAVKAEQESKQELASLEVEETPKAPVKAKKHNSVATPRPAIQISKQTRKPPLQEVLLKAYDAYQTGNTQQAQTLYENVLQRDGSNRDALLGLAALELQRSQFDQAEKYYNQVLTFDPRDTYAIAGLDAVKSGQVAGKGLNESQLKRLLTEQPDAHELHFSLGNLFAREKKWSMAQKSYFSAYRLDSTNPDYLFNLAVSLDHLGQKNAAKQFYTQAVEVATVRAAHFDVIAANKRMQVLSATKAE